MKIDWVPSPKLISQAKMINEMHDENKMTYSDISRFVKKHQSYVITLNVWYRNYKTQQEAIND